MYIGWDYSGIERWGHFKRLYDLPPMGPHCGFVRDLRLVEHCRACGGKGLFDIENGKNYESCGVCDGIGQRLTCTPEELHAVQQIARRIIELHKQKPWLAMDGREPVDRVLGQIADEPIRVAARKLLEERRFTDVVRILTWQAILDPGSAPAPECRVEDEEEPEEEIESSGVEGQDTGWRGWHPDADDPDRRADPPSIEEISRELHRLRELGLLGD